MKLADVASYMIALAMVALPTTSVKMSDTDDENGEREHDLDETGSKRTTPMNCDAQSGCGPTSQGLNDETCAYHSLEMYLARSRRRRNSKPYEVPDSCPNHDPASGARIQCVSMPLGFPAAPIADPNGKVFKFGLHLEDCEPVDNVAGKQRNEIKVWDKSPHEMLGCFGSTMRYTWSFFIDPSMKVTNRFTHLFQIKGQGGDTQKPFATFTGVNDTDGVAKLQVRNCSYSPANPEWSQRGLTGETVIRELEWSRVIGHWVQASVEVTLRTMEDGGRYKVSLAYANGTSILQMDEPAGMWRPANAGYSSNRFLKPKWGIYRANVDSNIGPGDLNNATVYFANLGIERAVANGNCS